MPGDAVRLNLGCGTDIKPGWINSDWQPGEGVDVVCNLEYDFPVLVDPLHREAWSESSVDEMILHHVLEHLHNPLAVMERLWWIAKLDCLLTIRLPHGGSDDAWEDPTHVRPYFLQSFGYFSQPYHYRSRGYGYKADWQPESVTLLVGNEYATTSKKAFFERAKHERNLVKEMIVVMRAVKPAREPKKELQVLPKFDVVAEEGK